jgi:uncharacterized phage protein (TIGR02220 family)
MGMEYARLYFDFFTSEKTQYLIDECGDSGPICLMRLWVRAGQRNNDGVFLKSGRALEKIAGWKGEKGKLVKTLTDPDFLFLDEISENEFALHNWDNNNPHLGEKAKQIRTDKARRAGLASAEKKKQEATTSQLQVNSESTPSQLNPTQGQLGSTNVTKGKVTKGKVTKKRNIKEKIPYEEIVDFLNETLKRNYKHTTKTIRSKINARFNEGFTVDDFKTVITRKHKQWSADPDMMEYLRPETLFGTKFESYLNQLEKKEIDLGRWA